MLTTSAEKISTYLQYQCIFPSAVLVPGPDGQRASRKHTRQKQAQDHGLLCSSVMPVRIRLARFGRKHLPFYRIVAADAKAPRDGRHLEILGTYNPLPTSTGDKHISLNFDRIRYWVSVGAQPSDRVAWLLGKVFFCRVSYAIEY